MSLSLCLRAYGLTVADDLGEHVALAQDQELVALDLDLGAAVLRVDDDVTLGDVHRDDLAGLAALLTGADGHDGAALRPLESGVRQHDASGRGLLLLERRDDQTIANRLQIHSQPPLVSVPWVPPGALSEARRNFRHSP